MSQDAGRARRPVAGALSYADLPTTGNASLPELMPGVRNLLDYARVARGERLLVIAEPATDPLVVGAIIAAAAYVGAQPHVLTVPPFSPGGWDRENPSSIVAAAYAEADVVISCVWWAEVHSAPLFFSEIPRHRARFVSLHMTATPAALVTGSRFPPEVFYAIKRAALACCLGASSIRVTTDAGTDVTFSELAIDADAGPLEPGMWRPWPLGGLNFYPGQTEGVLAIEESTVTGVPDGELRVELAGNVTTRMTGPASRHLVEYSPKGYYLRHAFIGLNPKGRLAGAPQFEREKHAGAFYLGLDGLGDGEPDRSRPGFAHCDCQFDRPTVLVDGDPLVADGRLRLLDDPQVREAAARFGPPDVILSDNPQLILPARYTGRE